MTINLIQLIPSLYGCLSSSLGKARALLGGQESRSFISMLSALSGVRLLLGWALSTPELLFRRLGRWSILYFFCGGLACWWICRKKSRGWGFSRNTWWSLWWIAWCSRSCLWRGLARLRGCVFFLWDWGCERWCVVWGGLGWVFFFHWRLCGRAVRLGEGFLTEIMNPFLNY